MAKKAIILGITGLVGDALSRKLLKDDNYSEVISVHRRKSKIDHPKLTEMIGSIDALEEPLNADVVFCCIGTTQQKTSDKEQYRAIDYGIPLQAAQYCKAQNIPTLIVISALGANPDSNAFYMRLKGEMERDVLKVGVKNTYFMQPSLIAGDREEKRFLEKMGVVLMKIMNPFMWGPLKKYRSIHPDAIAAAMIAVDKNGYEKARIPSDQIQKLADVTY